MVNGVKYNLKLEIGETDCRKGVVGKECNLKTPDGSVSIVSVSYTHLDVYKRQVLGRDISVIL